GYIEILLEKYNLGEFVTDIECYGNNKKGKADNIKLLVERNGLKNPVYVGDTAGDKAACDEAGVPFIFASYGFGEAEGIAKIDEFRELLKFEEM
ncbi:MAG: HAD family hydrolase, partial [Lachnospiraceae bacterium]|nr:HAD family hydrolase [Lachnospiraceae bacterium]